MRHLLCALVLAALASAASAQGQGLPDAAAVADPQPLSSAHHVMPAAASVAPEGGPTGRVTFLQLGKCTADTGMSSNLGTCQANAALTRPGQSNWYRFNVLEGDSAFTLHLLIRVQNGRVRMGLWAPGQSLDMPPSMTSDTLLSSSFAQELYITIPASQLFANPGIYILQVVNDYGAPEYTLQADVTSGVTLLAQQDRAALQQVVTDCCPSGDGMVCSLLTSALTADSMDTDICHQGPVRCDKAGHISDLVLQGTNTDMDLTCPGFSEGFAQLPELQRLDLAGANLGATTSSVGRMLAPAAKLKWLVLRTSGLLGDISCDILLPGLTLLSLTRNGLTGVIPDCLTRTESLLHLYLSDNALRGPLPDFSPTTSLQLLFARDQSVDGSPSLTGQLPASLASAPHLAYLQLSNVGLTGSVGTLPPMMRYFNVSQNDLSGMLPPLPQSLISFDISGNTIGGSLPADMSSFEQLVDIQAYFNELEGHLPAKLPPNLVQLALAGNRLTGGLPPLPRGLRYLSLAQNSLQGGLPNGPAASGLWFADLSSNSFAGMLPAALAQSDELVYLNVSNNKLEGIEEPAAWSTPRLLTLDASNNMIKGALAGELAAQPVLAYINFGNNQLSGDLEAFAKALVPDRPVGAVFDVSNNALTGGLPEGLGNLAALSTAPAAFPSWNPLDTTGYPVKVFNVADNRLDGPFPDFLITSMTGLVSQACVQSPGDCNMWVSVNGEGNRLACPAPLGAAAQAEHLPEHLALLQRQNLGCTGKDGTLYEVASVLAGHPVALRVEQAPERPEAQPVAASSEPRGSSSSTHNAGEPRTVVAAAAAAPAPASSSSRRALPPGAIAGIVIGAVAAAALVAALGYVVVYRRWYTVRAANSFKKMHEGPLAAAGGATINSSAPAAGLPTLGALAGDETV